MTQRTVATQWLASGDAGARETLRVMSRVVHEAIAATAFVWWARGIVQSCPPHAEACCAQAIRDYVSGAVWFQRDPLGVENITHPLDHMQRLADPAAHVVGDCDDAATLSAALGMAVGLPARFIALAFGQPSDPPGTRYTQANAPYLHVYTELLAGGQWREMDTTRPEQMLPPIIVRTLTVGV